MQAEDDRLGRPLPDQRRPVSVARSLFLALALALAGVLFPTVAGAQPIVSSLTLSTGPAAGGTAITVSGANFTGVTAVMVDGVPLTVDGGIGPYDPGEYHPHDASTIHLTMPAHAPGVVHITVSASGGTSATGPGSEFTYVGPTVTSVSPTTGPAAGGTSVVITGAGFTGVTDVSFGATAAAGFTVDSATQITATSPAGSAGAAHVRVTTADGTSPAVAGDQFTYIGVLVVTPGAATGAKVAASYSQSNPASGGVAPYSYAVASGSLPAGTSLNATTGAVTGTPTTAGAFSYAIQATDSQGSPATATGSTVSGTIAKGDQTLSFTSTAPSAAVVAGATYTPTATAAGSGLTVAFSIDGGGAVCSIAAGVVSFVGVGTCVVNADQAGDTNWNAAPRVQQSFAVGPPVVPLVASVSASVAYNTAKPIDLSASITGAHTSIAVGSAPSHGSVTIAGDVATYTPTTDYIGADSFTYTATGPGGVSSPATVSLTVAAPAPPVAQAIDAPAASSLVEGGGQNEIDLSAVVTGEVTEIQIVTPPSHGTVALRTGLAPARLNAQSTASTQALGRVIAVYTPQTGYVGSDSFQFVAIGPGGTSPPATVTLTVSGSAPTAPSRAAATQAGQPVDVNLTQGATEGPFTGAAILQVSPASAGDVVIRDSSGTYTMTFTPADEFSGLAEIDYTLSNAWGPSQPATISITVEPRPDPTANAEVRGLADAQAETVRRFGWTQLGNFTRRLETVRASRNPTAGRLSFASGASDPPQSYGAGGAFAENLAFADGDAWRRAFEAGALWADEANALLPTSASDVPPGGAAPRAEPGPIRVWSGGQITIGRRDGGVGMAQLDVVSSGVSGGADVAFGSRSVFGAGLGLGRDVTDVGAAGSESEARNVIGAAYFSFSPTDATFIDGVLGGGALDFDLRRFVAETMGFTTSDRSGALAFGSLGAGYQTGSERHDWSAYGRVEFVDADLHAYSEAGAGLYDLAYADASLSSLSSVLGARASFASSLGGVPAWPSLRVEWRHEFDDEQSQTIHYADWLTGPEYLLRSQGWASDRFSAGAGLSLAFERGWTLDLEGGAEIGDSTQAGTVSGAISKQF